MTPDQITQLRTLLKSIVKYYTKRNGQPNSPFFVRQQLDQALALLPCETCAGSGIKPFVKHYYCVRCNENVSEDHIVTLYKHKPKDRCPICKNKVIEKSTCPDCQ